MFFASSAFLFCAFLCLAILSTHSCFEESEAKEFESDASVNSVDPNEHGNFDFFGRDFIRAASRKYRKLKEHFRRSSSKTTEGIDCNRKFSNDQKSFKSRIRAIYPGTKWCGDGNISSSYDDLGKYSSTDKCCRDHDLCPNNIASDSTKYGLINTGLFTRSHCDCDAEFYKCLKKARNFVANSIGFTYFTILGPQCFREDYRVVRCLREERGKCVRYSFSKKFDKVYQWFDSPAF